MVQHAPVYIWYEQTLRFARETSTIIDIIKCHFLELVMAREGRKEMAETIKRYDYACSKVEDITQFGIVYAPQCLMCW